MNRASLPTDEFTDEFTLAIRAELAKQPDSPQKQAVLDYLRAIETTEQQPQEQQQ